MCGITGFLDLTRQTTKDQLEATVSAMAETLYHRGPDDKGVWVDAECGVALGFRRLAILDCSPAGHQPMHSACGRYAVIFNGEIYNFRELRGVLASVGHRFKSQSDTEVLLAAICQWGLESAVQRFNGMFAFAIWDQKEQLLHLVRDRIGEKPLYYGRTKDIFMFGSELKAIEVHPDFEGSINRDALVLYFRHNCIPSPHSIFNDIYKLPPATILTINPSTPAQGLIPRCYWSAKEVALRGMSEPFKGTADEAICELDTLLRDSVKLRMVADVPLGAFLSGGIDSSTVVALMQAQNGSPVKTFSIGHQQIGYNEAAHASAVAWHLGTAHTELFITPKEAIDVIPHISKLYDEPFADSSQIPTYLVSRLAREDVTVSLSGDGGDEIFGGYNRYVWGPKVWRQINWLPGAIRKIGAAALNALSPEVWESVFQKLGRKLPKKLTHPGDKLQKLAEVLALDDPGKLYLALVSHWKDPAALVLGGSEPLTPAAEPLYSHNLAHFTQQMIYLDTVTYLPDDILVKLDRASMAVSLGARAPLLDHRLVEFAWQLPLSWKIRNGQSKWLLRQVLRKYLPDNLTNRAKMGFAIPLHDWLRGPLRDWSESLLDERRLRSEGFLDPHPILQKWKEHISGRRNWQYPLWGVLMFESWLEENKGFNG